MGASRAMQNAVVGAAIVVELVVLVGHPLFGWGPEPHRPPATPAGLTITPASAPSARSVLLGLSAAAARLADRSAPARGRYAYVSLQTWQLGDQRVSGRRPRYPLTRLISTWRTASGTGRLVIVQRTPTGMRSTATALSAAEPPPTLTGPPASLDRRLGLAPHASTQAALSAFAAMTELEPVPPGAEARLLALLAGDAGLGNAGTTHDRAGRAGVAIDYAAPDGGATVRDTLVFDPSTGALLEFDRTLVGDGGGEYAVADGTLLSDTVYLQSGRVAALGARPRVTPAPR